MRRFLLITGLALACSGCAYGPDYGYGYGSSYPYGYGAGYGYAYPSYGYGAPYYGYAPAASVNFGFVGGGGHDNWRHGDEDHHFASGQQYHWSGGDGHQAFHGTPQAHAAPAPRPAPPPRVSGAGPGRSNAGKNYGGPG